MLTTHSAPQLAYPLLRSTVLGLLLFLVWLAGAVAVGVWLHAAAVVDWRMLLGAPAVGLTGLVAARSWLRSPAGHLSWDGQFWRWQSLSYTGGGAALELHVALDLRSVLWLRLENSDGAALWLWTEKSALPYRWLDLRRAVYCVAKPGSQTDLLRAPVSLPPL